MSTTCSIYVNTGDIDSARGESGVEFTLLSLVLDYLLFSNGSVSVADGESLPITAKIVAAGVPIGAIAVEVPKCFLADNDANLLKEVLGFGSADGAGQYPFCFAFSGITGSEPVLELWDSSDLDTIDFLSLGEGDPTQSFWWGICTTLTPPGDHWVGSKLGSSADGHFLFLNDGKGPLEAAKDLYCNLKCIIKANSEGALETPCLVVIFTTA